MDSKKFLLFFITLPFIIYGQKSPNKFAEEVAIINKHAINGKSIADNKLILTQNGFLGEGDLGFVYAGQLIENDHPVAIKFVPKANSSGAEKEFAIFQQLHAYANPQVEKYGIPAVYYHGEWESFILTAITKLDETIEEIKKTKPILPLDIMILFRNFVIQSCYMHSHGIRHGDVHSYNIMVRSHESFIIDFNMCGLMEEGNTYMATHFDWINFIFMVLELCDIGKILNSWDSCKHKIRHHIKDEGLLNVIKEFGDEAFSPDISQHFPNYHRLEEFINSEINKKQDHHSGSPPQFSWLSG